MTIQLLLVDDDDLVRTGLKTILEVDPELEVIGEASDGKIAIQLASRLRPDVILMDIQMPEMDGIEATRQICSELGEEDPLKVLVLTTFEQGAYVFEALRAGASGFLLKRTPGADIRSAIKLIHEGDSLLSPSITRKLIDEFAGTKSVGADRAANAVLNSLTEREVEVLQAMSKGMSNQEIAELLVVADGTIKTHVKRTLAKLGVRDRTQAVIFAYNSGLTQPGNSTD